MEEAKKFYSVKIDTFYCDSVDDVDHPVINHEEDVELFFETIEQAKLYLHSWFLIYSKDKMKSSYLIGMETGIDAKITHVLVESGAIMKKHATLHVRHFTK